jgi:hypothetical protein
MAASDTISPGFKGYAKMADNEKGKGKKKNMATMNVCVRNENSENVCATMNGNHECNHCVT